MTATAQRSARRAAGLCTYCAHRAEHGDVCFTHWLTRLARRLLGSATAADARALRDSFVAGRAVCAYTGVQLTNATAAAVHATPVSRGGARAVANVEWVTTAVAAAKGEMTRGEFVELCRAVAVRATPRG